MAWTRLVPRNELNAGWGASGDATVTDRRQAVADQVELYFEQYRNQVYSYVFSLSKSPERAEEIVQETFLRLYTFLLTGSSIVSIRAWAFRVAHNLAVNDGKKRRFEVLEERDWAVRSDPAPDPEQTLLAEERVRRFSRGMQELTDRQRQCMQLRAEGLRTQQIAEILRISRSSVMDILERATNRLRKAL